MTRIAATFERLGKEKRKALIPYVTAGFPFADITPDLMHAMVDAGCDVIELGVPFSDPMADGPVIQKAGERALALQQRGAHRRMRGHAAGETPRALAAQVGIGEHGIVERRGLQRRHHVVGVAAGARDAQPDGAIEQARIEVRQPVMRGKRAGDRALAARGGAVHGDDHGSAPVSPLPNGGRVFDTACPPWQCAAHAAPAPSPRDPFIASERRTLLSW